MKKYLALFLPLLAIGCANTVEVEEKIEYKCGEQVLVAEMLDDDSMIVRINGVNNVLTKVASGSGRRYENLATQVTFIQKSGDTYLMIKGHDYPLCQEIIR